ncbi:sporulation integral membrane protein YlbJ [Salsuginibacillus halophilus]|uniref:Sporulation integral membrane protein YlbJ n=1 Tax=Salsuginibacillus halophilus TaxID=517424 RepID=A0A2P8HX39_9BACI|nr:sporulation integral membrane protein YlbJ [Salsuginibacillus halophilus]PSL50789.1 sporulation integral membrane protein YlbJ [Salsuginibacillus halophilus]
MSAAKLTLLLYASTAGVFTIGLILFPDEAYEGAYRGLYIWWDTVMPTLLPFFVLAELLLAFGIVGALGVLCEPLMRKSFRLPGSAGFALALGFVSGYPAGAKYTARLYNEHKLNKAEAAHLLAFTNAANPAFIFGAVAAGFMHNPSLGLTLAIAHYGGNLATGWCFKFSHAKIYEHEAERSMLREAFEQLFREGLSDNRPLGQKLGDAVQNAVQTLLVIGGFMTFFSVLLSLTDSFGVLTWLNYAGAGLLAFAGSTPAYSAGIITGIFEMTLGIESLADIPAAVGTQVMVISFLLAFSGLSIQAQVVSIARSAGIPAGTYLKARLLHGLFASLISIALYSFLNRAAAPASSTPSAESFALWQLPAFFVMLACLYTAYRWIVLLKS